MKDEAHLLEQEIGGTETDKAATEETVGMGSNTPGVPLASQQEVELHGEQEFDFSSTISETDGSPVMSSADELFYNGQIKPLWFGFGPSHAQGPSSQTHLSLQEDGIFDFRSSANHRMSSPAQKGELDTRSSFRTATVALHEYSAALRRSARLTRSLSGTRVFHMDDEDGAGEHVQDKRVRKSFDNAAALSSGGPRASLKDLFQSDVRSMAKVEKCQILGNGYCYGGESVRGFVKKSQKQEHKHQQNLKSNINRGSNLHTEAAREAPYSATKADAEHIQGKKTCLPCRKGLLGCLSFTTRSQNHTCKQG